MDVLKLLLCVMLLLLCHNCFGEKIFRKNSRYGRANVTKRSNSQSNIFEEGAEPSRHKSKARPLNVDKTDTNIELTPKSAKVEPSNFTNKINLNKTSDIDAITPENINITERSTTENKLKNAIHIPLDLLFKNPDKKNKTETEARPSDKKLTDERIKKQLKIADHEPKISNLRNKAVTIDNDGLAKVPSIELIQKESEDKNLDEKIIKDDTLIEDDLDKRMGNEYVDKLLNLFPTQIITPNTEINKPKTETKNNSEKKTTSKKVINEPETKINNRQELSIDREVPQEKVVVNYATINDETSKEQTDTHGTKIKVMNNLPADVTTNNPVSSIVIHNNSYQEVIEPVWYKPVPYLYSKNPSKVCLSYGNYYGNTPYYYFGQCLSEIPNQYKSITYDNWPSQYSKPYTFNYNNGDTNRVWKSWHNMDICINTPKMCERISDGWSSNGMK